MLMGQWVTGPDGQSYWVPKGWHIKFHPRIQNIRGRDPRKNIVYNVSLFKPPIRVARANRIRKAKRKKHAVHSVFSRFRERDLDAGLFIIGRRDRRILAQSVLGQIFQYQNGKRLVGVGGNIVAGGDLPSSLNYEKTWDQIHPGPPYSTGGPFKSVKFHLPASMKVGQGTYTNISKSGNSSSNFCGYSGSFVDDGNWAAGESYSTISSYGLGDFPSLSPYYDRAWDQLKPKLPKAGLAQFLYELKDLPGQLKTTAEAFHWRWKFLSNGSGGNRPGIMIPYMSPREAADQFLNEEFGWKPFISDLLQLHDAFVNSSKYIGDLVRDNGVYVRKSKVFSDEDVTSSSVASFADSGTIPSSSIRGPDGLPLCKLMSTPVGSQLGYCSFSSRTKTRIWGAGSFRYYRPEFDSSLFNDSSWNYVNTVRQLMTLYGLRISPTLLYKIYPWTWAVDWFTGLGKHIERLDDFVQDGIVAKYLYVMETIEKVITKTSVLNFYDFPVTVDFQRSYTKKIRENADSPYGFNAPWNILSPRQWAILGAIGITRSSSGYITRGA